MKIALAQINCHIGNLEANAALIKMRIDEARGAGAQLVVFPEMSICGYLPDDLLFYRSFVEKCNIAAQQVAEYCTGITAIIGVPGVNPELPGKDLYNEAWVIENGAITHKYRKGLLPTYDVFDEYRYFEPARAFACVNIQGLKVALTICEDLWDVDAENALYLGQPMDMLVKEQPEVIINIAASPFSYIHDDDRRRVLAANCKKYNLPLLYCNVVGGNTEILFDGGSMALDANGRVVGEMAYYQEDLQYFTLADLAKGDMKTAEYERRIDVAQIYDGLVMGLRDYFSKQNFTKAVIGLSGGIDSAVVTALATDALGAENVLAVLMPSKYSSNHSVDDALALVNNLGCAYEKVPIIPAVEAFGTMLRQPFEGMAEGLAEENIQARIRGTLLMAFSNKLGHILLNTSNKSEVAVGYGTLYGDMAGALCVIGDVYKTQVYELAEYINRNGEIIPQNTINKAPSAELKPGQKDSDSLPDYAVLDKVLFGYIEEMQDADTLVQHGFEAALVARILKMVKGAEFKRRQAAPILRVSPKAFGIGRRVPIVAKY